MNTGEEERELVKSRKRKRIGSPFLTLRLGADQEIACNFQIHASFE